MVRGMYFMDFHQKRCFRLLKVQSLSYLCGDVDTDVAGSVNGLCAQVRGNKEVVALEQRGCEGVVAGKAAASP